MASITRLTVAYGRTTNLGNFNSLRLDVTVEAQIEENDNREVCIKRALHIAKEEVERATIAELEAIQSHRDAIFNTLKGAA